MRLRGPSCQQHWLESSSESPYAGERPPQSEALRRSLRVPEGESDVEVAFRNFSSSKRDSRRVQKPRAVMGPEADATSAQVQCRGRERRLKSANEEHPI